MSKRTEANTLNDSPHLNYQTRSIFHGTRFAAGNCARLVSDLMRRTLSAFLVALILSIFLSPGTTEFICVGG